MLRVEYAGDTIANLDDQPFDRYKSEFKGFDIDTFSRTKEEVYEEMMHYSGKRKREK